MKNWLSPNFGLILGQKGAKKYGPYVSYFKHTWWKMFNEMTKPKKNPIFT